MRVRSVISFLTLVAACSGPAVRQSDVRPAPSDEDAAAATITATDMEARVAFLASDALRGRDTPSQGL
ncbi:MAG: hypothetical protein ACT4O1_06245, partial [Gemmatimonadota bacterium]